MDPTMKTTFPTIEILNLRLASRVDPTMDTMDPGQGDPGLDIRDQGPDNEDHGPDHWGRGGDVIPHVPDHR